jgi:hypothetical protein
MSRSVVCLRCGAENAAGDAKCASCGEAVIPLGNVPPPPPPREVGLAQPHGQRATGRADPVAALIPYKNGYALTAYYLAVFSLIPILGMPLGLAALVLGIFGLRKAKENPEIKGTVHAWIGIILGGVCGFAWLAILIIAIPVFAPSRHY